MRRKIIGVHFGRVEILTKDHNMELREIVAIFQAQRRLFGAIVGIFLLGGILFLLFQPQRHDVSLVLNVTRSGANVGSDYAYDDFYRLQADERFADTVVRWLSLPGIVNAIFEESSVDASRAVRRPLGNVFKAQRLSSQVIHVTYVTRDEDAARKTASALTSVINRETEKLNAAQQEKGWFVILADAPVVSDGAHGAASVLSLLILLGIFFGAWGVLLRHYLREK